MRAFTSSARVYAPWTTGEASNNCDPLNGEPMVNPQLHSASSWCCCTHNCAKYCLALDQWCWVIKFYQWNKSNNLRSAAFVFLFGSYVCIHRWSISTSKSRAWKCWSTLAGPSDRRTNLRELLGNCLWISSDHGVRSWHIETWLKQYGHVDWKH